MTVFVYLKGRGAKPTAVKHYDTFVKRLSDVGAHCLKDRLPYAQT